MGHGTPQRCLTGLDRLRITYLGFLLAASEGPVA
jgi:hypothetical protein